MQIQITDKYNKQIPSFQLEPSQPNKLISQQEKIGDETENGELDYMNLFSKENYKEDANYKDGNLQ